MDRCRWRGGRTEILPDGVAPEDAVLVAFLRRLPLDHDGLVGPAASDDVLRRGTGRLLWKRDTAEHTQTHMQRCEERGQWAIENHHEHSFSSFQAKNTKLCNNVTDSSYEAYQFKAEYLYSFNWKPLFLFLNCFLFLSFLALAKKTHPFLVCFAPPKMQCPPSIPHLRKSWDGMGYSATWSLYIYPDKTPWLPVEKMRMRDGSEISGGDLVPNGVTERSVPGPLQHTDGAPRGSPLAREPAAWGSVTDWWREAGRDGVGDRDAWSCVRPWRGQA